MGCGCVQALLAWACTCRSRTAKCVETAALDSLQQRFGQCSVVMLQIPLSFIYGELDWTNPVGGARVCEQIQQQRGQLTDADLQITSILHAGHYPFLDQPDDFMTALLKQTRPYRCSTACTPVLTNTFLGYSKQRKLDCAFAVVVIGLFQAICHMLCRLHSVYNCISISLSPLYFCSIKVLLTGFCFLKAWQ